MSPERCGHTPWKIILCVLPRYPRCHTDDSELEALVTHTGTKGARGEMSLMRAELLGLWLMFSGRQPSCSFIGGSAHWESLELLHIK